MDDVLPHADIGSDAVVVKQRHAGVIVGMVADEVPFIRDAFRRHGGRLRPPPLDEERCSDVLVPQGVQDHIGIPRRAAGAVGMFGVERQGDPGGFRKGS
jgi:hypothetical protein